LHSAVLRVAVAAVLGRTLSLLVGHVRCSCASGVDRLDLDLGVPGAEAGLAPAVLAPAELADRHLRALDLVAHDGRRHGRAGDVRRADPALAVAADRAHLVEGQCAALFDAAAEVDLDSLTGRHPVLLVAIVDDGEHWTASWSAAALAAERAWHDSDRRPSFKAAGAERAEPGARRAGSLLAGLLLLLLLDEQQFDRARQRLAAQVAEADHALVVEHEDRRPAADPPAGRDRAARPLGAAPEAAPRDAVLLRLGVELVEV